VAYCLEVKNSYCIDSEVLESTHLMFYFPQWSTHQSFYVKLQSALITQPSLCVYVNPQNSTESVLLPGVDHVPVWLLPTVLIMMLVCPLCFIMAIYVLFLA
jgi:hypothetical protein